MYLWFEMYLMLSQKVVLAQFRFGMLGQRLEGEQALSTSSPWVLGLFVAWVPADAAAWVRGWGSADVLCFTHCMSLGTAGLGRDIGIGISGMACAHEGIGGLFAEQGNRGCRKHHENSRYSDKLLREKFFTCAIFRPCPGFWYVYIIHGRGKTMAINCHQIRCLFPFPIIVKNQ